MVWMEEADQFEERDFNELLGRNRGKAGGFRQIILTNNPNSPLHWIYRRMIKGDEASVYYSRAADNPHNPPDYQDKLGAMTGLDGYRLRDGLWVQASGVVFETWADSGPGSNVTEQAEYDPEAGEVIWLIDDGYSAGSAPGTSGRDPRTNTFVEDAHPRAILFAQYTSQGFLNVFDEDYACQVLSDVHIERAKARPYPMPEYVAHGPGAAEIRGRLFAAGLSPVRCTVTVEESIKEMRGWLSPDLNGVRMLRVHPRCADFRGEMLAYAYDKDTGKPIKRFDHGLPPPNRRSQIWLRCMLLTCRTIRKELSSRSGRTTALAGRARIAWRLPVGAGCWWKRTHYMQPYVGKIMPPTRASKWSRQPLATRLGRLCYIKMGPPLLLNWRR